MTTSTPQRHVQRFIWDHFQSDIFFNEKRSTANQKLEFLVELVNVHKGRLLLSVIVDRIYSYLHSYRSRCEETLSQFKHLNHLSVVSNA